MLGYYIITTKMARQSQVEVKDALERASSFRIYTRMIAIFKKKSNTLCELTDVALNMVDRWCMDTAYRKECHGCTPLIAAL